ncbi:hypothetical protein S7711_04468 [Stachybotrys chartarum IBT 7711]|uniref:lytic cellulose monooxygenase (C4-dehydrogenating) n=1 Tax=Stachybotrys chartarum (strain CBS 109288 / IBT 7711) TaxID=1280523 RepID=A0A084BA49_STACB|nr:hypothetical protein S7711_04468 [Stachybotrys chartarum IBT 7711]KFA55416.1 hypothetical protein S40293_10004 [Stachybotrys chartarum IBT 40293]KFA81104.1 hypothetical protein S40288_01037 [Stachybotrys chartarum IBT 40288]
MQFAAVLLALSGLASAHYTIPRISSGGVSGSDWQYTRRTENHYSNGPVTNVASSQMTCYELSPGTAAPQTLTVSAGSSITFTANSGFSHPGPVNVYLARAPSTAASFDGRGAVWFKIYEDRPTITSSSISWPSYNQASVTVPIPRCVASGEYLVRFEHIAVHSAGSPGGAQLYLSCSQINITGGTGTARPNLLSFPGAYSPNDPGLLINIYWPVPQSYTNPGGRPLTC